MADAFIYDHVRTPRGRGKPDGSLHLNGVGVTVRELEVQLKEAREKSRLFEAVIDVLKKDYGVRVVKKPVGKSSRKSPSKG